jgi:hypothetical protein
VPTIDNGSLLICLQALERAIQYNEFLSQSETVDADDFEEINYRYELTLNKLAQIYNTEAKNNPTMLPINQIISYQVAE